jgi:hypothetical protein
MLAQHSPSALRALNSLNFSSHIARGCFADMAMDSLTLVLVSLLFNAVDALTIGNFHSLQHKKTNPNTHPPGARTDTLVPRISYGISSSGGGGRRTKKNYIIAFSLVGAALVGGFIVWLVLRHRRREAIGKDPLRRKGPPVAEGGGGNLWFGQTGITGRK